MRIRQVKPAFWADARLGSLPEPVRLFYIGLWMEADDAGYFRWDPIEIARDLYGFDSRVKREKRVVQMFDKLLEAGRVVVHSCGHEFIPTFTSHQRFSGPTKLVKTFETEHRKCIPQIPAGTRGDPATPRTSPPGKERIRGTEGEPERFVSEQVARPLAASGAAGASSEFAVRLLEAGVKPELVQ